jgi:hypothetical protein
LFRSGVRDGKDGTAYTLGRLVFVLLISHDPFVFPLTPY